MSIIKSLQEVLNNQEPIVFETKDGSSIHIEPEHAVSLASVHDNMNKENQEKMRNMMEESEEQFVKVLSFCNSQLNEEE